MDTSKEYIKMCDKSGLKECCSYSIPKIIGKVNYIGDNVFVELDQGSTTWRTVRLLRQSQIQEMMLPLGYKIQATLLRKLYEFSRETRGIDGRYKFPSMEQLWLAFYMYEKHEKSWSGEWVDALKSNVVDK